MALTRGACPRCTSNKAIVARQGEHLAWDAHTYTTWGGLRLLCSATGQRLCDLPARDVRDLTGLTTPQCLHASRIES